MGRGGWWRTVLFRACGRRESCGLLPFAGLRRPAGSSRPLRRWSRSSRPTTWNRRRRCSSAHLYYCLGARPVAHGARPEHYPVVGEVLIASMAETTRRGATA